MHQAYVIIIKLHVDVGMCALRSAEILVKMMIYVSNCRLFTRL